jgi:hypothetical protein
VSGFQMVLGPFGGHFVKTNRKPDIRVRFSLLAGPFYIKENISLLIKRSRLANRSQMSGTGIRSNRNTDRSSVFGGLLYYCFNKT